MRGLRFVFRRGRGDSHCEAVNWRLMGAGEKHTWSRQTIQPVHLDESSLLVGFIGEPDRVEKGGAYRATNIPDEAIAPGDTSDRI